MRPLTRLLIVTAVTALVLSGPISAAHAAMTFDDEFNSGPLNTTLWKTVLPWGTQWNNREQQWYDPANLSFPNGGLEIVTKQGYDNGYPYSSGIVTSRNQQSYGYFETRAKLPKGQGVWPAFWLLNDGTQEIDIFELLGNAPNKIYMTYHRGGSQVYQSTYTLPSGDFSQAYHTFGVDVQPGYIKWYVDGVLRGQYYASIPSNTGNIILNTAVGDSTSWPGAPNSSTTFPQYFDADYVRTYPTMAEAVAPPAPPANTAPAASADSYATDEGTALSVTAPGVLANDTDADGNPLSASLAAQPAHGTVALASNGSFIYTPAEGFSGTDTFTYRASDGSALSGATAVSITVRPVNHAPSASADSFSIDQDSRLTIAAPGLLANDTDPDGDSLTALVASQPSHGMVSLAADGSFVYTPAAGFYGTDTFTYRASDGSLLSAPAAVTVMVDHVNHAPVAAAESFSLDQDTALTIVAPGVLANDSDPDGDALTAQIAAQPAHGTVALAADGSFVYTPDAGFSGADTFSYQASDGALQSAATAVTLTVVPVVPDPGTTDPDTTTVDPVTPPTTDPGTTTVDPVTPPADPGTTTVDPGTPPSSGNPPVSAPDAFRARQDMPLTVAAPGVLANDTDADGDPLTAQMVSGPAHGTLSLAADGSFVYVPDAGWYGTDSFSYRANDGTYLSGPRMVTVDVMKQRGRSHWRDRLESSQRTTRHIVRSAAPTSPYDTIRSFVRRAWGYCRRFFQ